MVAIPLKLHYFSIPGRGEASRLMFKLGGVPFQDVTHEFAEWPKVKPKMPLGQMPVLEFADGRQLAQSGAIDRYVAKLTGFYPTDPLEAALADQAIDTYKDFLDLFSASSSLPAEEKIKARQAVLAGKGGDKLKALSKLLEPVEAAGGFVAGGSKPSYGDLALFSNLSFLISGFFDGVPATLLHDYPALRAYRNRIASLPAIQAHYAQFGEGVRAAFKPDAELEVASA